MSKKDFIALADMIRNHNTHPDQSVHFTDAQILSLATFCQSQNSNFMRERWIGYINGANGSSGGRVKKVA